MKAPISTAAGKPSATIHELRTGGVSTTPHATTLGHCNLPSIVLPMTAIASDTTEPAESRTTHTHTQASDDVQRLQGRAPDGRLQVRDERRSRCLHRSALSLTASRPCRLTHSRTLLVIAPCHWMSEPAQISSSTIERANKQQQSDKATKR